MKGLLSTQIGRGPIAIARILLVALAGLGAVPSHGFAQTKLSDLRQMSIEDLMAIEITSAARKEQRALDVAAAVFVITHDDIRRSGMTTIPDLLRLAPGVDVAQINSNKWAVSVRGFNGLYANKLLVLVDGRSIYNRLFSGVLWAAEDLMLDDIDRIEVIRGPGAATWGANGVNGVINIVTRAAADTQGALVRVEGGRSGEQGAVRYGGSLGTTQYRLYAQWSGREPSLLASGAGADDASHSMTAGFRADRATKPDALTLEGSFTVGQAHALWPNLDPQTAAREPIARDPSDARGGHLLARWTHTRPGGASLQAQSFVDIAVRQEPIGKFDRRAFDVETQYHTALGGHHDLVAGAGYRFVREGLAGLGGFSLTPAEDRSSLVTAFMQDEIALFADRLAVTLGSQLQYDSNAGAGVQPTARVMWKVRERQRLWAATSRALRTPSLNDRGIRLDLAPVPTASGLPLFTTVMGNPTAKTEEYIDAETGYRLAVGTAASIDVTGYVGRYDGLRTQELAVPVVRLLPSPRILAISRFGNELDATTRGLEVAGHWSPATAWRVDASYTAFHVAPHLSAASRDPAAATEDGSAPATQWQFRSLYSPGTHATVTVALFHVGSLERYRVDAYTRADIGAEWRFARRLSIMAIGQNLFDAAHPEFAGAESLLRATRIPRSVGARFVWGY